MSEMKEFKCPNCGGRLEFDSVSQKLKCPFCDGTFEVDDFNENVEDSYVLEAETFQDDNVKVYVCNSCGGTIMAEGTTVASTCPYCGNPVLMDGTANNEFQPKRIIPFKLDKAAAKSQFKKHLQGKFLLPKAFSSDAHIDEIQGLYVPFWLFDGNARAALNFDATKVRTWSDSDYDYRETSYYHLYRSGTMEFSEIPVDGSSKMADELMQSIEPFETVDATAFKTAYLAGYVADKYDVDDKEAIKVANNRIRNSAIDVISSMVVGYDTVMCTNSRVNVTNGNEEYVFFPVWILNTSWNGQKFTFSMNGQTGKFVGNLPMDKSKATITLILVFVLSFIIMMIVMYLAVMR